MAHSSFRRVFVVLPAVLGLAVLVGAGAAAAGPGPYVSHDIRPGAGVTRVGWLSEYHPALKGTPGDTRVYVLEGSEPGATVFVAGGTHGNEIAGAMAATVLVEKAVVTQGRLIVIPRANNSAATYAEIEYGDPGQIWLVTPSGPRAFRYGARRTHPDHQGVPDPAVFVHPLGAEFEGAESRNLDRVHPGRADGTLTEQVSYAIVELLRREKVHVAFDLHEAGPTSRLANMLVSHPKGLEIGALALLNLEYEGISMKLEHSSVDFRGLSHREWGDATPAYSYLIETPNPAQASAGSDERRNADPVNDPESPLWKRVGTHLDTVRSVLDAFAMTDPGFAFSYAAPGYAELEARGLGASLN
ncbi:succinylglutamate desuccinylase [Limnochorda pilosa]|uniref:Succinylglutamate desuccinylase n=2 Tax=Limnochorda pilosa TaxID=1555112 RepID=A0A0K2SGQ8_LIMPI|nr:succinylglutamate desuccinylase [Limnochorda pilosa]